MAVIRIRSMDDCVYTTVKLCVSSIIREGRVRKRLTFRATGLARLLMLGGILRASLRPNEANSQVLSISFANDFLELTLEYGSSVHYALRTGMGINRHCEH